MCRAYARGAAEKVLRIVGDSLSLVREVPPNDVLRALLYLNSQISLSSGPFGDIGHDEVDLVHDVVRAVREYARRLPAGDWYREPLVHAADNIAQRPALVGVRVAQ